MKRDNSQADDPQDLSTNNKVASQNNDEPINRGRRKIALGAAPVLLTMANTPAMARYCTMSGRMSGNMSGVNVTCYGKPPTHWAQEMVPTEQPWTERFNHFFDCTLAQDDEMKLKDCVVLGDNHKLANICAAYCNIQTYGPEDYGLDEYTLLRWCQEDHPNLHNLYILHSDWV